MFNSIINIITDVLFASLPISVIWNLQVNLRTKLSLLAILSLGYLYDVPRVAFTQHELTNTVPALLPL